MNNGRDVILGINESGDIQQYVHYEMMNQGIYCARRGFFALSTPMTEREIKRVIQAMENTLEILKPYIKEAYPALGE